ncbi:MAG: peptide ABC transporter substrate-binding protein [Devosia sp.]
MKIHQVIKAAIAASAIALMMSSAALAVTLNLHNGSEPRTLDPAKQNGNWEDRVISDMIEGMMTIDNKGNVINGQAASYEVSEDGLTYTFKIRNDAVWSDGTPVTAKDFVTGLERLLNPATAATYASLAYFIEGAQDYNTAPEEGKPAKDPSMIGIKAIDDKTVQYKLRGPTPYFLSALIHPSMYPVPSHKVAEFGEDWSKPENIIGNGAYKVTEFVPGSHAISVKNDKYYDAANVKIDDIKYFFIDDTSAALALYRSGGLDIMSDLPTDQLQLIKDQFPGQAPLTPILSVYYYEFNQTDPVLKDPEIRKALSTTINRLAITDQILASGVKPQYSWVPPGIGNYEGGQYTPDWQPDGSSPEAFEADYAKLVADAKAVMESKGYTADNKLKLTLRYNANPDHERIAIAVASMWDAINVSIELVKSDSAGPHYTALEQGDFQIGRSGWGLDFNDPQNMLELLLTGAKQADGTISWGNNHGRYSNPKYDELIAAAGKELDLVKRSGLMHEAEKLALDEFAAAPIYTYVTKWVVSPKISGYVPNPLERHFVRYMSKAE